MIEIKWLKYKLQALGWSFEIDPIDEIIYRYTYIYLVLSPDLIESWITLWCHAMILIWFVCHYVITSRKNYHKLRIVQTRTLTLLIKETAHTDIDRNDCWAFVKLSYFTFRKEIANDKNINKIIFIISWASMFHVFQIR